MTRNCQRVSDSLSGNFYPMKIIRSQDCGNSPKNALLTELEISFAGKALLFLQEHTSPGFAWSIPGFSQGLGLESFLNGLDDSSTGSAVVEIEITSAFSHGKMGSVSGKRVYPDGNTVEFCSLYEFSSAGSTKITSLKIFLAKDTGSV